MDLSVKIQKGMIELYEMPIPFWQDVLGEGLHFHLGHFPAPATSLEEAMRIAVRRLISAIPARPVERILDVGCGWGGPAFELARNWDTEVLGLTISKRQTRFMNEQADVRRAPVQAITVNVEDYDFDGIGSFDILWLYDVLEHIADRRLLFLKLHRAARKGAILAISMHCRTPHSSRELLYSDALGIQLLETSAELERMLQETGWKVLSSNDYTALTRPVWKRWADNLKPLTEGQYREEARKLGVALANTEGLYRAGMLESIQIVAKNHNAPRPGSSVLLD